LIDFWRRGVAPPPKIKSLQIITTRFLKHPTNNGGGYFTEFMLQ
jgi:hypothetical protein